MRHLMALLTAAGSSLGLAPIAAAADLPVKAPPPPMVAAYHWSGFYVGGYVGAAWGRSTVTAEVQANSFFDNNPTDTFTIRGAGVLAGGTVGYNVQLSNIVLGVEIEGGRLGAKRSDIAPDFEVEPPGDLYTFKYGGYALFGGRFGVASDRWLIYAKAGVARARVSHVAGDLDGAELNPAYSFQVRTTLDGWAAGGGVEYALSGNWTFKAEYLYFDFEDLRVFDGNGFAYVLENSVQTVKFGLNYRFGGPIVAKY